MSILREKRIVRLNAVIEAAIEAADFYEEETERVGDEGIARLFARLGRRRREMSERLSTDVRRMGDLPFEPDVEAELVHEVTSRIRAATEDTRQALLEERLKAEEALQAHIQAALDSDLPPDILYALKRYAKETQMARAALSELLAPYRRE